MTFDPIKMFAAVESGKFPDEVREWLIVGFTRWRQNPGATLSQCLRLPAKPQNVSKALRDRYLLEAAKYAEGSILGKAKQILETYQRHAFSWSLHGEPQDPFQAAIYRAWRVCDLPKTQRQLFNIIYEIKTQKIS